MPLCVAMPSLGFIIMRKKKRGHIEVFSHKDVTIYIISNSKKKKRKKTAIKCKITNLGHV